VTAPAPAAAAATLAGAPDVLICAGLDPSGGAGLIADVRIASLLGCRPAGVVTALTVQNTTAVIDAEPVAAERVREQLEFLLSDIEVRAVKIGMIGSSEVAEAIARALALTAAPVVWDPIVQPSRGAVRFAGAFEHALAALAPQVTLLTPNAGELAALTGMAVASEADAALVGGALAERLGIAVLVKGGHLAGDVAIDVLCLDGRVESLRGPRIAGGEHVHGTGCALASAIAAHLAHGADLVEACRAAKDFVAARIAAPVRPGRGGPAIV